MSAYELTEINARIKSDPANFVREADALSRQNVVVAANSIKNHMKTSRIVLLSGPSGSGKTTTALKLEEELERQGVSTVTVSMDNYFRTLDPKTAPRTPEGEIDFESPDCVDVELLNRHFTELSEGREVTVPHFDFASQTRSPDKGERLLLKENEVAIFEGIHALRDSITDAHPEAFKLYISASSVITRDGKLFFESPWLRLVRRVVRDNNFRGSDALFTLGLWSNVLRGEKLYIDPFSHKANIALDSTLPYEVSVLKRYAEPLFRQIPPDAPLRSEMEQILSAFPFFEPLSPAYVGAGSLIREFIGGSSYYNNKEEEKV